MANRQIKLKYCQTDEMIADMFTKGLSKAKLIKLREMAGIKKSPVYIIQVRRSVEDHVHS